MGPFDTEDEPEISEMVLLMKTCLLKLKIKVISHTFESLELVATVHMGKGCVSKLGCPKVPWFVSKVLLTIIDLIWIWGSPLILRHSHMGHSWGSRVSGENFSTPNAPNAPPGTPVTGSRPI